MHALEQPSHSIALASSHVSPRSTMPSPHMGSTGPVDWPVSPVSPVVVSAEGPLSDPDSDPELDPVPGSELLLVDPVSLEVLSSTPGTGSPQAVVRSMHTETKRRPNPSM